MISFVLSTYISLLVGRSKPKPTSQTFDWRTRTEEQSSHILVLSCLIFHSSIFISISSCSVTHRPEHARKTPNMQCPMAGKTTPFNATLKIYDKPHSPCAWSCDPWPKGVWSPTFAKHGYTQSSNAKEENGAGKKRFQMLHQTVPGDSWLLR